MGSKTGSDAPDRDYYPEINELYEKAADSYGLIEYGNEINYGKFTRLAKSKEREKDYLEAIRIYQDLSEVIADNMGMIDDSDGYYGDCFVNAMHRMTSCIKLQAPTHEQKRSYMSYMFEKYIKNDPDYFQEHYHEALESICADRDDYEYWKSLLEPYLPDRMPSKSSWSKHYDAVVKIRMYMYILEKLNDESIDDCLAKHYRDDSEICIAYAKRLKNTDPDRAMSVMEGGLKIFDDAIIKNAARMFSKGKLE